MSTTVTYKGSTLTTVNNQTRTLKTAGKYMEGDVVLTDISESGTSVNVWQDEQGYVHLDDEGEGSISVEALSVTQNGTYTAPTGKAYSPVTVNVSGGGSAATKKQINFIDYDGTIVESYTATEWQNVTALPSNPSHTGLTAQGWNWTKAQIDEQLTAAPGGDVWVGQMYITTSGDTEIDVSFVDSARLSPYLSCAVNGTIIIDWGDNSTSTVMGTSLNSRKDAQHVYASAGDYTITIHVESGSWMFYGTNTYTLLNKNSSTSSENQVYSNCVQNVRIGADTSIGEYAFSNCYSLASITIPSGVTNIGSYAFYRCYSLTSIIIPSGATFISISAFDSCSSLVSIAISSSVTRTSTYVFTSCYSLASITIPSGVTSISTQVFSTCRSLTSIIIPSGVISISNSAFENCQSLASVTIPSSVTNIGSYAFSYCYPLASITIPSSVTNIGASAFVSCCSLASITIPSGVTNIGSYAFSNCYGMAEYHFLPTTPPTLASTSAFSNIPSDCIIYVPQGSLEAYQTATNWSTYASYMQEEPA